MGLMDKGNKIYVAGHRGLAGSAIVRRLRQEGFSNLALRSRQELNLANQAAADQFFATERPRYVVLAAAKVGGILANSTFPGDFIRENLLIQTNVIDSARRFGVAKLLFLGSSCIYPKLAPQPIKEEHLLTGALEPTGEPYAIAKIAGLKMCQAYRAQYGFDAIGLMPTNLYGPNDNFDPVNSHVLAGLIRRIHEAKLAGTKEVPIWGTGLPRREFLHADDLADAAIFLMRNYSSPEIINVGAGVDISIDDLAAVIRDVVGYQGSLIHDFSKPDGTPRKLLDVSRLTALGWKARVPLRQGIAMTYEWFLQTAGARRNAITA